MEDFIPYELAVKLKEKGFNEVCYNYYEPLKHCLNQIKAPWTNKEGESYGVITAPTISQVLMWLREDKKIHLVVDIEPNGYFFIINYNITTNFDDKYEFDIYNSCSCYYDDKQAALAGIEYVIDNLI